MPSVANSALLLSLEAYSADNNIRRAVLTVSANVQGSDEGLLDRSKRLDPAEVFALTCVPGNKGTVIRCMAPLDVVAVSPGGTLAFKINSLFVFTDELTSLTFTNPAAVGTNPVRLRILQI